MTHKDALEPKTIYCCDDHAGWSCSAALPTVAKLADHIARSHGQFYNRKSAIRRANERYLTTMEAIRDDLFYALGFKRCISAWADDMSGHFVQPERMNSRYDCDDCLAKRAAEAA